MAKDMSGVENGFFPGHHWDQWFFNGFASVEPSPLNVFWPAGHWLQWFFNWFWILGGNGQRWLGKSNAIKSVKVHLATKFDLVTNEIKSYQNNTGNISQYLFTKIHSNLRKPLNNEFEDTIENLIFFWRDYCNFQCFLRETINIECFLALWPLTTMVFQWFWGCPTIGFNGFRWSRTIGQTMEWFQWIAQV